MKYKTLAIVMAVLVLCQAPVFAAFGFSKSKKEQAAKSQLISSQSQEAMDQSPKATALPQETATATLAQQNEKSEDRLTKEEQEELFQEQKDLKEVKDSDRLVKESVSAAALNRSLSNRPVMPVVSRSPERPAQNPNLQAARAPERPAQNPNSQVARAPERPARR